MYAMSTGFPPFRGETSYGTLSRICATQPQPIRQINPDIPQWLVAIIEKLHAKKPEDRFQSAQQVADLLQQCLAHLRQPDAAPLPATVVDLASQSVPTPMRRAARPSLISPRHLRRAASNFFSDRWLLAQIAIGLIAAYVAVTLYVHPKPQPAPPAPVPTFTIQTVPLIVPQHAAPIWNDEVSRDLSQLQTDVSQLENRIFRQENSTTEAKP
jgi:serine/threonine protein kinase